MTIYYIILCIMYYYIFWFIISHILLVFQRFFQVFKEETRQQEFKLTWIRQTCDRSIGIPEEQFLVTLRKWEVIKHKVTINEQKLTLIGRGGGKLSHLYFWLNEAETVLESYENGNDGNENFSTKYKLDYHKVILLRFLMHLKYQICQHVLHFISSVWTFLFLFTLFTPLYPHSPFYPSFLLLSPFPPFIPFFPTFLLQFKSQINSKLTSYFLSTLVELFQST